MITKIKLSIKEFLEKVTFKSHNKIPFSKMPSDIKEKIAKDILINIILLFVVFSAVLSYLINRKTDSFTVVIGLLILCIYTYITYTYYLIIATNQYFVIKGECVDIQLVGVVNRVLRGTIEITLDDGTNQYIFRTTESKRIKKNSVLKVYIANNAPVIEEDGVHKIARIMYLNRLGTTQKTMKRILPFLN